MSSSALTLEVIGAAVDAFGADVLDARSVHMALNDYVADLKQRGQPAWMSDVPMANIPDLEQRIAQADYVMRVLSGGGWDTFVRGLVARFPGRALSVEAAIEGAAPPPLKADVPVGVAHPMWRVAPVFDRARGGYVWAKPGVRVEVPAAVLRELGAAPADGYVFAIVSISHDRRLDLEGGLEVDPADVVVAPDNPVAVVDAPEEDVEEWYQQGRAASGPVRLTMAALLRRCQ